MKSIIILPLLLAFSTLAGAGVVDIYRVNLRGPVLAISDLPTAIVPAAMPSMKVYSGAFDAQGNFDIDLTDKTIPSPDPEAKAPRRFGIRVKGTVTLHLPGESSARILFKIRECRHLAYTYSNADKRFFPSWTESYMEIVGRIDKSGWGVIDSDPVDTGERTVYIVRIGNGAT